jgi:imidazole glycerol-phosphate synthase subunit HisH
MSKTVSIIDYGLGNILSVSRAVSTLGFHVDMATTVKEVQSSDFLILPGVGSFNLGVSELRERALFDPINQHMQSGKPLLGICLGMQLLFESSEECKHAKGFGFISGKVVRVVPDISSIKVPHIGWSRLAINNNVEQKASEDLAQAIDDSYAYFVHSYHPEVNPDSLLATSNYQGHQINAMVKKNNVIGCQFHPEKSGAPGKEILKQIILGLF